MNAASRPREQMRVFVTVDTELWPLADGWPDRPLAGSDRELLAPYQAYIDGRTAAGSRGLPFLLEALARHELKATFFVEPLFSRVSGPSMLRGIVSAIENSGQEVQLHAHTEWLGDFDLPGVPRGPRPAIADYEGEHQLRILETALELLGEVARHPVIAFRAGSYAADGRTLAALERLGIRIDSSYNACHLGSSCRLGDLAPLWQPRRVDGVWEFPIACFSDFPGHLRHAQLCAVSFAEMRRSLMQAWRQGWSDFVIVLHSSELVVKRHLSPERPVPTPDRINLRRFARLCEHLAANRDRYVTTHFRDLPATPATASPSQPELRSPLALTALRYLEQAVASLS